MMNTIHFLVNMVASPLGITVAWIAVGLLALAWRPRLGKGIAWCGTAVALLMGLTPLSDSLAQWLEKDYPLVAVENLPAVDAIVVLGGGIGGVPEGCDYPYPHLRDGADRVWHAARIWRDKSKDNAELKIYCTCPDVSKSTPPFLRDLGVPEECIVPLDGPWNTEAEAKRYDETLRGLKVAGDGETRNVKVCLVTSALHMKRAVRIFKKYAPHLEVVPAAIDHTLIPPRTWRHWVPNMDGFSRFNAILHECIGLVRYW